jgi:diadenosine tetraphosphate (Ap4A) HIT family hydrolase
VTRRDKINVAALGDLVPQLHIHIVARFLKCRYLSPGKLRSAPERLRRGRESVPI